METDGLIERRYSVVGDPGRIVIVSIGAPRLDPDPTGDWMCLFSVDATQAVAHGVDALQALLNAIEGARVALDASGLSPSLVWAGGEPGLTGLPRTVPFFFGRAFAEKLERYIDQELEAFAARAGGDRGG